MSIDRERKRESGARDAGGSLHTIRGKYVATFDAGATAGVSPGFQSSHLSGQLAPPLSLLTLSSTCLTSSQGTFLNLSSGPWKSFTPVARQVLLLLAGTRTRTSLSIRRGFQKKLLTIFQRITRICIRAVSSPGGFAYYQQHTYTYGGSILLESNSKRI